MDGGEVDVDEDFGRFRARQLDGFTGHNIGRRNVFDLLIAINSLVGVGRSWLDLQYPLDQVEEAYIAHLAEVPLSPTNLRP
jgi:hypothetical protein